MEGRDAREKRRRSLALAFVLLGLVMLLYLMTMAKVHP
jgi:hypothetical protein